MVHSGVNPKAFSTNIPEFVQLVKLCRGAEATSVKHFSRMFLLGRGVRGPEGLKAAVKYWAKHNFRIGETTLKGSPRRSGRGARVQAAGRRLRIASSDAIFATRFAQGTESFEFARAPTEASSDHGIKPWVTAWASNCEHRQAEEHFGASKPQFLAQKFMARRRQIEPLIKEYILGCEARGGHCLRVKVLQIVDAYRVECGPIDFSKRQNFGYAFVNMSSQEHARRTIAELDGASWCQPGEGKAVVSWSLTQGLDLHVERYRNSPVMHEAMLDQCKPIVLEGGVRVDFPPPTRKVQRLRRLRTRCGSRGRGVSSSGLSTVLGTEGHGVADAPGAPAVPCVLFPGLSSAPEGGAGKETDAVLASTLLAGLVPEAPDPRKSEALSECSASASASRSKKAAWADLQDDLNEGRSECSTQPPGYSSSTFSSDGSGCSTDGLAARWRGTGTSAQPWTGSILAGGLMPELPEEAGAQLSTGLPVLGSLVEVVGTYPSGAHAVIVATDHEEDTYTIQLTHNGCRTRRQRTVRCKHVRLLRHTEVGQLQ
ncbi:unnamed protein product [Prorocentrum cordatum]|uniref:RRM domain-containing protein n=1 Tax=Prorocentrum cordatum TaxID=2364126 RepID=A0ABN9U1V8_9DINO|nr:unnamed protein product [Polarella glacialis]